MLKKYSVVLSRCVVMFILGICLISPKTQIYAAPDIFLNLGGRENIDIDLSDGAQGSITGYVSNDSSGRMGSFAVEGASFMVTNGDDEAVRDFVQFTSSSCSTTGGICTLSFTALKVGVANVTVAAEKDGFMTTARVVKIVITNSSAGGSTSSNLYMRLDTSLEGEVMGIVFADSGFTQPVEGVTFRIDNADSIKSYVKFKSESCQTNASGKCILQFTTLTSGNVAMSFKAHNTTSSVIENISLVVSPITSSGGGSTTELPSSEPSIGPESPIDLSAIALNWGLLIKPFGVPDDIVGVINKVINVILGLALILTTLVIIFGGLLYLTSGGEDEKITRAKKAITYGIIGLMICALAFAITVLIKTIIAVV